jgi:hypothetical protein
LILLDELMDYALGLSNAGVIDTMPGEQVFLNALMDASDDVVGVVFVVVMIRSELDPEGYTPAAENFREYIARRLNRNGTTVAVTETGDFAAIIRRRIFEQSKVKLPVTLLVRGIQKTIEKAAWTRNLNLTLGTGSRLLTAPLRTRRNEKPSAPISCGSHPSLTTTRSIIS